MGNFKSSVRAAGLAALQGVEHKDAELRSWRSLRNVGVLKGPCMGGWRRIDMLRLIVPVLVEVAVQEFGLRYGIEDERSHVAWLPMVLGWGSGGGASSASTCWRLRALASCFLFGTALAATGLPVFSIAEFGLVENLMDTTASGGGAPFILQESTASSLSRG